MKNSKIDQNKNQIRNSLGKIDSGHSSIYVINLVDEKDESSNNEMSILNNTSNLRNQVKDNNRSYSYAKQITSKNYYIYIILFLYLLL